MTEIMATRLILHGLQRLSMSWESLEVFNRIPSYKESFLDKRYSSIYHDIRLFTAARFFFDLERFGLRRPYLKFYREGGELPNLQDIRFSNCSERRLSVTFMSGPEIGDHGMTVFRVLLMTDGLYGIEKRIDTFMNWGERGFIASGPNAGYMIFQSVLHGMLVIWGTKWSSCLDEVNKCVSVNVSHH